MGQPDPLCTACLTALKEHASPTHPVDPETLQPPAEDMRGVLVCPTCLATWMRFDDVTLLHAPHLTQT